MKHVAPESLSSVPPWEWPSSFDSSTLDGPKDSLDPRGWSPEPTGPSFISLSSRIDCCAIIDREDAEWSRQWLWSFSPSSGGRIKWLGHVGPEKLYARRTVCVRGAGGYRKSWNIWLHREICRRVHGEPPSQQHVCDHLDGNSLNCRRENLRWATLSENAKNRFGSAWLQLRMPGV